MGRSHICEEEEEEKYAGFAPFHTSMPPSVFFFYLQSSEDREFEEPEEGKERVS
jgi:hypothetical protein